MPLAKKANRCAQLREGPYNARLRGGAFSVASSAARPIHHLSPDPDQIEPAPAAAGRKYQSWHSTAADQSPRSKSPSLATRRPASLYAQRDRQNDQKRQNQWGARRRRWRRWRATVALLPLDRLREEDMRKHNNGRSGVNVKVEELNGRANERGDKDFITRG